MYELVLLVLLCGPSSMGPAANCHYIKQEVRPLIKGQADCERFGRNLVRNTPLVVDYFCYDVKDLEAQKDGND